MVDVVIGGSIFALAFWLIVRSVRLSRNGTCAGCALRRRCGRACGALSEEHRALAHKKTTADESGRI